MNSTPDPDLDDIAAAILNLHDELARDQVDLPADERALIHLRQWELYGNE